MAVEAKNVRATDSIAKHYRDIKAEFKKITWASRDEVFKTTGIVLTTIIMFVVLLWLYDSVFGTILSKVYQFINK